MVFEKCALPLMRRLVLGGVVIGAVAGCDENGGFALLPERAGDEQTVTGEVRSGNGSVRMVERDVEAPDVFQMTDMGLWDGRPSLGGVWVAHPDVKEPERVIIRTTADDKFVIGALFRRERELPGPAFQVSSDAAAALGMLAGAPAQLNVTALRREEAPDPEDAKPSSEPQPKPLAEPETIEATPLEPIGESAAAAIDAAEAAAPPEPAGGETAPKRASSLDKPFIQIGIFSVEQNARNTGTAMRQAGMVPSVRKQSIQGKPFWRVVVGPTMSASERSILLKKVKDIGFEDAYFVSD